MSGVGLAFSGTAAHLGGELSFGRGVRANQNFAAAQPREFTAVLDEVGEGPAVFPQPRYEARVSGGKIELRAQSD